MVVVANELERQGHRASKLKSKDAKRQNLFGCKLYSTGSLQLRIANQRALLSYNNFTLWENVIKFKDKLTKDCRQDFAVMTDEGKVVARTALQDSLDGTDVVARIMASTIYMRRCSWLQLSMLPQKSSRPSRTCHLKVPLCF